MSESDWERFLGLVERFAGDAPTTARAAGVAISMLLEHAPRDVIRVNPGPLAWMDWEQRKNLRLLRTTSA